MAAPPKLATLDDLMRHEGKAELIGGRVVELMATGRRPNRVAFRIARSLDDHAEATGVGEAYTDNMGFAVPELTSGRESFSPDASYYDGPFDPNDMRMIAAPPTFAVEVRSENDYSPSAEIEIAAKRADYYEAGTTVVWDVDPVANEVRKYTAGQTTPVVWRPGDIADAEPAVPGWRVTVEQIFR
ncbi:MAG: Uma2 family endonuclease [Gemmataceae bacterium]